MKFAASLFSILLFINGIMLTFQYHVYSDQLNEEDKAFHYNQDIDVVYRKGKLIINHHLSSLPNENMKFKWPAKSIKKACSSKDKNNCSRLNKTLTGLRKGKTEEQTVAYVIPVSKKGLKSGQVLQDVFLTLQKGTPVHTTVHITDETRSGGQWITGLPEVNSKSLKLVQYTMFSGNGPVTSLYWQKSKMKKVFTNDQLTLYGMNDITGDLAKSLKGLNLENFEHVAVIETNKKRKSAGRILFTSELNEKTLEQKVILSQIHQKYKFDTSPSWAPAIVASFLSDRTMGSDKAKKMIAVLKNYMNQDQLAIWKKGLEKMEGKEVTTTSLDHLLSESLQLKTSFFDMNANNGEKIAPLLFEDKRPVYINELQQKNMQVIFKDGRILYSVKPILKNLGYTSKVGTNGFYVKSDSRSFRFPMDEPFYVYNNHRYDFISQPIEKYGNDYYVEEAWLVRLFLVNVEKSDKRIDIITSKDGQ
ncbi:hypothetical protein ACIQ4I_06740 [Rummeliibacillus sp. NPDC094406]|uniref:hypothetical protein n=1 Tax=Rummeliibacillus sp. NPDC094406 TaxID=3364511 RepID=UPI0037F52C71